MMQASKQAPKIGTLIEDSNSFYQELLGYKPEKTSLHCVSEDQWNSFADQRGLNLNSSGIYLPRNQMAIVRDENPLSLFHEYFGHGLYCEQSLAGMKLVDLERRLLEEEKNEFEGKEFTLDELIEFRQNNPTAQNLEKFRQENLGRYELFAVWTEYLLSGKHSLEDGFGIKYDSLPDGDREVVDSVINFSKSYGDLATMYAFGLARVQDRKRLLNLSNDIYGKKLDRTRLITHFGSGKPFSDIDLFVVSNDIISTYDPWLDVRVYKLEDIERNIRLLNPMVTDPIMVGNFVFGGEEYMEGLKQKIVEHPITEDAIRFSLDEYGIEMRRARDSSLGRHLQSKNLRSAKIFLTNALALKNGNKILSSKGLVDYSHILSRSENFIELKGGIE